jgi:hypothetical protein
MFHQYIRRLTCGGMSDRVMRVVTHRESALGRFPVFFLELHIRPADCAFVPSKIGELSRNGRPGN